LRRRALPARAQRVQMFFKHPIETYGWRTAGLRKLGQKLRREIAATDGAGLLFPAAEKLFAGKSIEEQALGVILLERAVRKFGATEFRRLQRWLPKVRNWAACDALCVNLLGPLLVAHPKLVAAVFGWLKAKNPWLRRVAAVALVPSARRGLRTEAILRVGRPLLRDQDYMVAKGVGWLLKEAAEKHRKEVVALLEREKARATRLALRTACDKLPLRLRRRILS
jgi:3-methyladenine DNA glycosylase AlkD